MVTPWKSFHLEQDSWENFWGLPVSESSNAEAGGFSKASVSVSDGVCYYYSIR